jgi:glycosyltransferase involved in cell wall biosynthesis
VPDRQSDAVRVLYSFPHKIGSGRICYTAWHQVAGAGAAGASMSVHPGVLHRRFPDGIDVRPTLARGRWRIPYKALGRLNAFALHDRIVARRLARLRGQIDVVHTWPLGALETLRAARALGIPTVLERPNAHTGYAYEVVKQESQRIGVPLPPDHEHAYNEAILRKEEEEYALADYLLCPSEFTAKTFLDAGYPAGKLVRHWYGFDEDLFFAPPTPPAPREFTMVYVGVAAVRKGLHYALEAWLRSPASETGSFLIAGEMLPAYGEKLAPELAHPSVRVLGHRDDVPDLMRASDVFVLPTIEEGFGLVCTEALACGAVPLVSEACTDLCVHEQNALVHRIGDVDALTSHITRLYEDRLLLARLRENGLRTAPKITWAKAGERLLDVYREVASARPQRLSA